MDPELIKKKLEYEARKTRTKLALNICTICGKKDARPCKGCGTTAYCSTDCQRIDWRDRGHRKACKKIRRERAAEAARAEAPTPPPSPPKEVVYGPAPRSHADEVRARIAAEHEAARLRREANPEPEPLSARLGNRCPICLEEWDMNVAGSLQFCCCRKVCDSCKAKITGKPCPLCLVKDPRSDQESLALLRRHVENEVPEAIYVLGSFYMVGRYGLQKNTKKAAKIFKRAVELGNADAMSTLGALYKEGNGVKIDKKKALQLWSMASDRGHAYAQLNIGVQLHINGKVDEAFRLFELSARQGLAPAEFELGRRYAAGIGVEPDPNKCVHWLRRAAARGEPRAIDLLAQFAADLAKAGAETGTGSGYYDPNVDAWDLPTDVPRTWNAADHDLKTH